MPEYKSRSQKKRESHALQNLGENLSRLSPLQWRKLALEEDLQDALHELNRLKAREARRRQLQYVGRLMRRLEDPERLEHLLTELDSASREERMQAEYLDRLREQLLHADEKTREAALQEAAADLSLDSAHVRHLVQAAFAERQLGTGRRFFRELYRFLRSGLGSAGLEQENLCGSSLAENTNSD